MAPLSVQREGGGTRRGRGERAPTTCLSRVLAATPPERRISLAPLSRAARIILVARTSATASWNAAAVSAVGGTSPSSPRTRRRTAVFRPLKLKREGPAR